MPELPEVETVRRGLQPVMEGATIVRVEQRRPNLRFPFPKGFARTADGPAHRVGRPAREISHRPPRPGSGADLPSRHVGLVPHRGGRWRGFAGALPSRALQGAGARPRGLPPREWAGRRAHRVQRSAPLRLHAFCRGRAPFGASDAGRAGHRANRQRARRRGADRHAARHGRHRSRRPCSTSATSPGSATSMCARRCGGPGSRRNAPQARSPRRRGGRRRPARCGWPRRSAPSSPTPSRPAARRSGTTSTPTARSGYFQHAFCVYGREGEPCPRRECSGTVTRMVQSGRSTFYCPACQR